MSAETVTSKHSPIYYRRLSVFVFSLFSSWLLSFPFEGQVLYAVAGQYEIDVHNLIFSSIIAHFAGLILSGFFIKNMRAAKRLFLFTSIFCMATSLIFFFPPTFLWNLFLMTAAFLAGGCIAAWSIYYKAHTPAKDRLKTAADLLLLSNLLMILVNTLTVYLFPEVGLSLGIALLGIAFLMAHRLPEENNNYNQDNSDKITIRPVKPIASLCLFIVILSINSGLMYQVIIPAYAHHEWLVGWYWALPYLIAIIIMRSILYKINRGNILYVAVAMIGLSFIAFMVWDRSVASYLLVNTLMMGACGIFDLFWWSILGEMLEWGRNPVKILGIGLSANVLGVLLGGLLGGTIEGISSNSEITSVIALVVVFVIITILPLLHNQLSGLVKDHIYLTRFSIISSQQHDIIMKEVVKIKHLTDRESEIASLLMKGRTYKMIAEELFLSENTIKTHVKNIYSKLEVQNKAQLIKLLMEQKV